MSLRARQGRSSGGRLARLIRRKPTESELDQVHPNPDEWLAAVLAGSTTGGEETPPAPDGNGGAEVATRGRRRWGRILVIGLLSAAALGAVSWVSATALLDRAQAHRDLDATRARLSRTTQRIAALTAEVEALRSQISNQQGRASGLREQLAEARAELKRLRAAAAVPNGKGVVVETKGYADLIQIHDVHLTHAYGFSDLVGIAVNMSGRNLSYVQLGCSFLDAKGRVLANVIDNRESWPAGSSWGFDCGAEVKATGGIVRVDAAD
jgi:cell division protein FtsB